MGIPVHLVKGNDDILVGGALSTLLDELVGDGDRSLLVDEFDLDTVKLGAAIDAAQTIPFLTDRRIVVVRRFGRFSRTDEVQPLIDYLQDPLPSTALVLAWEKAGSPSEEGEPVAKPAKIPPALTKAVTGAGGEVIDTAPGRKLDGWVSERFAEAGLQIDGATRNRVVEVLGDDAGALVGLIGRLSGTYGEGARLRLDDVEPYLGRSGGVPPWDLTDAIDRGDVPGSIDLLHRMMEGGDRHPLAIMATLQGHYTKMARLDGAGVRGEKEAAELLGMAGKSTFPAKKALTQSKRLGSAGVKAAVGLLARADVDLRGARAWPEALVMEVLVARLARLSRAAR